MSQECEKCLGLENAISDPPLEDRFDNPEILCSSGDYPTVEQCPIWGRIRKAEERDWQLTHVVHDAKNQMVVAYMRAQLAMRDNRYPDIEPALRQIGNKILCASEGLNDVMDLKRMERREVAFLFELINVHPLLDRLIEDYRVVYNRHEFIKRVPLDVRDIRGDRTLVPRVFSNLLANAVKYSPDGGEIRVCAEEEGGSVHFSVTDEGIGIPLGGEKIIFEKFGRAHRSKRFEGLGVGLALAKEIVEAHQGQIWASSPGEGQGSTFHFTLPIYQCRAERLQRSLAAVG